MKKHPYIWVVDDDTGILEAMKIMLELSGYIVETLSRSSMIKDKLKHGIPALILLDVFLSGEDGRKIAKNLKADQQTKNVPVILVSASSKAAKNYRDYGADGFLAKPFDIDEVLAVVERYLNFA